MKKSDAKHDARTRGSQGFDSRSARDAYLDLLARHANEYPFFADRILRARDKIDDVYMGWLLLPGLELERRGEPVPPMDRAVFENMLSNASRLNHANWTLPIPIWILLRYGKSSQLTDSDRERLKRAIIHTKFWMDEPGEDQDCYFTENHQIIFHIDEYLAGQTWLDERFPHDGKTGAEHKAHAETAIRRWLGWRMRFGFSEWKSLGYSDAILKILLTLREFTEDDDLRRRADMVIDTVLLQYALYNFNGDLACSQGRSTWWTIMRGEEQMPSSTSSLLFGTGKHTEITSAASILLSCGSYEVPPVLQAIARHNPSEREVFERESLDVEEAEGFGVDPADDDNIMFFWGAQLYDHRDVIETSNRIMPWPGYYMNARVQAWREHYRKYDQAAIPTDPDPDFTATSRADEYLFKTPHWQLSCVRDFRKGKRGFGQHIWQATLGGKAMVFANHPGSAALKGRPNYWSANSLMPRAAAHRNVCIAIYWIDPALIDDRLPAWNITHAYFPQFAFDEVAQVGRWVCGRKADGYIALGSMRPAYWRDPDPAVIDEIYRFDLNARTLAMVSRYELVASGHTNVWVCELGDRERSGSFRAFVEAIESAEIEGTWEEMSYTSPGLGRVQFGWDRPFTVGGEEVDLHPSERLTCAYGGSEFGSGRYEVEFEGHSLLLDHESGERALS
jgi:hypothetical protein